MRLLVFDLDTALCQTDAMDGLAMASAVTDLTGKTIDPQSIGSCYDLESLWRQVTDEPASTAELTELRRRFSFHLRRQFLIRPSVVPANYRAIEQVNALQDDPDTLVGLISHTSEAVMQLKCRSIGLVNSAIPVASGDDSELPEGILSTLRVRIRRSYGLKLDAATLIAGDPWQGAAIATRMARKCPEKFFANEEPIESRSRFSLPSLSLNFWSA